MPVPPKPATIGLNSFGLDLEDYLKISAQSRIAKTEKRLPNRKKGRNAKRNMGGLAFSFFTSVIFITVFPSLSLIK